MVVDEGAPTLSRRLEAAQLRVSELGAIGEELY